MSTLEGIDVSHYQEGLSIAKSGVAFAIMKATESTNYVDPTFEGFAAQCKAADVLYGFYHFAHTGSDAEADWFVDHVAEYVGSALLVLDWEAGAVSKGASAAKNFLDRVYERTGIRALLYTSQSVANSSSWSAVAEHHRLWVARYSSSIGATGPWDEATIWQHTSAGSVPGYSGSVDKDHFYGTAKDWKSLAGAHDDSSHTGGGSHVVDGESVRGPSEAVHWADDRVGHTGYGGMCLQFTREAYGIAPKYDTAGDAWDAAMTKHRTTDTEAIPRGAPVFFSRPGSVGHVAVSTGSGLMDTTHASTNKIGKDHLSTWVHDYGYTLLGWSEDLNGVTIIEHEEDEEMPKDATASTSKNWTFAANDAWRTLPIGWDGDDAVYTLVQGHAQAQGNLYLQLHGATDLKIVVRTIHHDGTRTTYEGFPAEYASSDGDTAIIHTFTERIAAGERLRFQIKVYGDAQELTVGSVRARALYWEL